MDKELRIGMELLDYVAKLEGIIVNLSAASTAANGILGTLNLADTYEGKAKESMELFAGHLGEYLEKLMAFYTKAGQYVYATFESLEEKDAAMSIWLSQYL